MISVINDPIVPVFGNGKPTRQGRSTRTIYHENGINKFEGYACRDNSADSSLTTSHRMEPGKMQKGWVNVDGRLGVSYMGDGECIYANRHFYKIWRAVEDDLEINSHRTPFTCSTGDTVCELVSLWLPEQSPGETRKAEINIDRKDEGLEISAGNWICRWDNQGEPGLTQAISGL
ncbi:MAG: hypothetical protein ACLFST_06105 [Spirochaetia bacterium]